MTNNQIAQWNYTIVINNTPCSFQLRIKLSHMQQSVHRYHSFATVHWINQVQHTTENQNSCTKLIYHSKKLMNLNWKKMFPTCSQRSETQSNATTHANATKYNSTEVLLVLSIANSFSKVHVLALFWVYGYHLIPAVYIVFTKITSLRFSFITPRKINKFDSIDTNFNDCEWP